MTLFKWTIFGMVILALVCVFAAGADNRDDSTQLEREIFTLARQKLLRASYPKHREAIRDLLDRHRQELYRLPLFHLLYGETYEKGWRYYDARDCYLAAAQRAGSDRPLYLRACVKAVDMEIRSMRDLYLHDRIDEALELINVALRIEPELLAGRFAVSDSLAYGADYQRAMNQKSWLLCIGRHAADLPRGEFRDRAEISLIFGSQQIERYPNDPEAQRMYAIACLDLGHLESADRAFRKARILMGQRSDPRNQEGAACFSVPPALTHDSLYTELPKSERAGFLRDYWEKQDRDAPDLLNQKQLQYWHNLSLAMLWEERPWDTTVGTAMILMGVPQYSFGTGVFDRDLTFANGTELAMLRHHPADEFLPSPRARAVINQVLQSGAPIAERKLIEHRQTTPIHVTAANYPDLVNYRSRLRCSITLPKVGRDQIRPEQQAFVTMELRDSAGDEVDRFGHTLEPTDLYALSLLTPPDSTSAAPGDMETDQRRILIDCEFNNLLPGRYTLETEYHQNGQLAGFRSIPVVLKSFYRDPSEGTETGRPRFVIGGIEPFIHNTLAGIATPVFGERCYQPTMQLVPQGQDMPVYYPIFGLATEAGEFRIVREYMILPAAELRQKIRQLINDPAMDADQIRYGDFDQVLAWVMERSVAHTKAILPVYTYKALWGATRPMPSATSIGTFSLAPGDYVCVIKVIDMAAADHPVQYTAAPFKVLTPDEYEQTFQIRR